MSPRSSSPDAALPSKIGRYEVVRMIGEGAMGRVLLAHDPVLGRDVAVKLLRDDLRIPPDVREGLIVRMRHEARAAARVAHPNLVTLHDMGEDDAHGLYLVFEYVEGPTLKQRVVEGRLAASQAGRLARELGVALTFAHRAGIVHRDVKPENVILSATGGKIADFGIARIPDSTLTHAGGLLGTPAYSAPETFRDGKFSAESDQFSLASTLYEAIAAKRAFPGDDAVAVATRIAREEPEPIAADGGLDPSVDDVLLRAMAKDPKARFPSCEAFGQALARALSDRRSHAGAPAEVSATATQTLADAPAPERKVGQVVLGGAVVVVTAILLLRTALRSNDLPEETAPPTPSATTSATAQPRPRPPSSAPSPSPRPRASARSSADPEPSAAPLAADAGAPGPADAGPPPDAAPKPAGDGG